jgi:hypothetical protein
MSTPEGTSGNSGQPDDRPRDQHDQPIEPIDPTLTFDAYSEKHATSSTADESTTTADDVEPAPANQTHADQTRTDKTHAEQTHTEPAYTKPAYSEPTYAEPAYTKPTYTEPTYTGHTYTEHTYTEDTYTEPAYAESGHGQSARTSLIQGSEASETVAPARFSAPTWTPTAVDETRPPTEIDAGPRAVRMRTVVLGLVFLVIAGAVLVGQLTDVTVNAGAIVLALMIGGGLLLIAGARRA